MFRSDLEKQLKRIFTVKNVLFDSFRFGKEQDALFVDIDIVRDYTIAGKKGLLVLGRISLCGLADKNKYGWLHAKIEMARKEDMNGLAFERTERAIKFEENNDNFIKYDLEFSYVWSKQFNPVDDKIEGLELEIQEE